MPRLCPACRAPALVQACRACLLSIDARLGALWPRFTVDSGPRAPYARMANSHSAVFSRQARRVRWAGRCPVEGLFNPRLSVVYLLHLCLFFARRPYFFGGWRREGGVKTPCPHAVSASVVFAVAA